jgi:hypothetical protein
MRKKFIYIGLLILFIALVIFIALIIESPFSGAISKIVTTYNLSAGSGGFYDVPLSTSNSIRSMIYVALNGSANVYLFNTSTFAAWSSRVQGNASADGLASARSLGTGIGSLIESNVNISQITLTDNLSATKVNGSVAGFGGFNGTAYVVIDNTKGSRSSNGVVRGVIVYLGLTQSNLGTYESIGAEVLVAGIAEIALGIAGIVLIVYGVMKKAPEAAEYPGGAKGAASKEYIDSLYKNVGKKKK